MSYEAESLLKPSYKKYKNRTYKLQDLNDFNNFTESIKINTSNCKLLNSDYFKTDIVAYEIGKGSGFYYIPNPFKPQTLLRLIVDSITKWPTTKNRMNLDIESDRPDHIWNESIKEFNEQDKKLSESWLYKLRWTSLGYHYQWTDRVYKPQCHSDIPVNLNEIMKDIIGLLNWKEFIPEAAIVNYYHINSAMCFHQDHAELAKDVPLVSISISQPGVYLLGTSDPTDEPVPIALYHGDVVVMSGPSRQAYHAVPKIVKMDNDLLAKRIFGCPGEVDPVMELMKFTDNEQMAYVIWQYLQCSRININMRQVLNEGQAFPA